MPKEKGLTVIYGPNESGKTTLLEGIRSLLFGWKGKEFKQSIGLMTVEHEGMEYTIHREGKRLTFYPLGKKAIPMEPRELWWHGLDRKTYERIFALTLGDLQGLDILKEQEVRSRFFGVEGGERLSETVKDIEKAAADLLVQSANGKKKINVCIERLKQLEQEIGRLAQKEGDFVALRQQLDGTVVTEKEIQESLRQWQEYNSSIDLVLRAWDTYKRAEEAKSKMNSLMAGTLPEQERFMALDREINNCQEHMRIWRGKEDGLRPDNFSPTAPVGIFSAEIDALYEQLARWEQLQKECRQGETYIKAAQEQLNFSRTMQSAWRSDEPMPEDIDWIQGERLSRDVRMAEENIKQWKNREPMQGRAEGNEESYTEHTTPMTESDLELLGKGVEDMRDTFARKEKVEQALAVHALRAPMTFFYTIIGLVMAVGTALIYFYSRSHLTAGWVTAMVLTIVSGGAAFVFGQFKQGQYKDVRRDLTKQIQEAELHLSELRDKHGFIIPRNLDQVNEIRNWYEAKRRAFYGRDFALAQQYGVEQQRHSWTNEGRKLTASLDEAKKAWDLWKPKGSNRTIGADDFFALKQEYDTFMEKQKQFHMYKQRLGEHQEELRAIVMKAQSLWEQLGKDEVPTPLALRQVHKNLQTHRQNKVRWEQKEGQRKTYREEYDQWHRKEKDLLLQQDEILQKAGFSSATEFRHKMLSLEQYKQWETIYNQSNVQLKLLAPNQDVYDLLLRRLRDGNKGKWEKESSRGREQISKLENQLGKLFEQRGELSETMRNMESDSTLSRLLQEREQLETLLRDSLEDWATQVFVSHFIERAQQKYEQEKQPEVIEMASSYLSTLTRGVYSLTMEADEHTVIVADSTGKRIPENHWSSGLGDQIYLAMRLSLAKRFGQQVEPLPIILDDILLRFDEERQVAALQLLSEIGQEEQIFLFTCQEQLMRLVKKMRRDDTIFMYRMHDRKIIAEES